VTAFGGIEQRDDQLSSLLSRVGDRDADTAPVETLRSGQRVPWRLSAQRQKYRA
jgi:hypothetical protein